MNVTNKKHKSEIATERYERMYSFFRKNPIGVLSTSDSSHNPHGSVIYCSTDEHFNVTFTTKRGTYKHENLQANNNVSLLIYNAQTQTTAILTGKAEEVQDEEEESRILNNMMHAAQETSESGIPPLSKLIAGGYVAYRIKPSHISMAVYARPDPGGYELFETIDF